MSTANPRINVTFDAETVAIFTHLAHKGHTSLSNVVKQLALEALEIHEDYHLYKLVSKLDTPDAKFYSSEEAWK